MPIDPGNLLSIGDVTATTSKEGTVTANIGDVASDEGFAAEASVWSPAGFYGRPLEANGDGAAQCVYWADGNEKRILGMRDRRALKDLPELKPGECCMYTQSGSFVRCAVDGSIMMYCTDDNTPNGRGIYFDVSSNGFDMSCPWGRLTLGPNGFHVLHSSGARLDLGAIAGLPAPLDSLASYAKMEAGIASVKGGAVSVGTDGGVSNEAGTTGLFTFLSALVTAIGTITTTTPGASAMGSITPLLTTLQQSLTKIGKNV